MKYTIVEPFGGHENQFVRINQSDAYTLGSVDLSDNAVIMIEDDCFEEIPEEERDKYKIVRYKGEPQKCLENFLKLNGYDVFDINSKDATHYWSEYMFLEKRLGARDRCINWSRNNTYLSGESIELTKDEALEMFSIALQNNKDFRAKNIFIKKLAIQNDISPNFFDLFISSGIIQLGNGKFTFKSDQEILNMVSDIKDKQNSIYEGNNLHPEDFETILNIHGINIEEIKKLQHALCKKEFENLDMESFFKENESKSNCMDLCIDYYTKKVGNEGIMNKEEPGDNTPEIIYKKFQEILLSKDRILSKKVSDYESEYKEDGTDYTIKNATKQQEIEYEKIKYYEEDEINNRLKENGITKYSFNFDSDENGKEYLVIINEEVQNKGPEEVKKFLQGKNHMQNATTMGYMDSGIITDFKNIQEGETVAEYLGRLTKYTENFSKYYDGEKIDESIKFDENGDLIGEQKIGKEDFKQVATDKEAVIEVQEGKTVKEIREEMNPEQTKEEKAGVDYGE